jgi:hemerythrin-like domain-containing protein
MQPKVRLDDLLTSDARGRRRALLGAASAVGLTLMGAGAHAASRAKAGAKKKGEAQGGEEDVGPGEDLMREHGVLRRTLLVYGEIGRRLESGADFDLGTLQKSAQLIRTFVEDYHERQEEEMVFPRFERAHKLVELVSVLRAQHQAGRKVTERVQSLALPASAKDPAQRRQLRALLLSFIRMYEPHASREDTVLFPALHDLVSRSEYDALGEDFERREHQVFGEDGFEHAVTQIDAIEKSLGIENLAQFTPVA